MNSTKLIQRTSVTIKYNILVLITIAYRFLFTIISLHVSSSKIIFHSLRSIPVEGEYCLSTNDHLIRGKIGPTTFDKISVALFLVEPPPQPLGGVDDEPRASFTKAPLAACDLPSPVRSDPPKFTRGRDVWPASSSWSTPDQSSPMLTLDDPPGTAPAPSL
jgi:hypothetical protein